MHRKDGRHAWELAHKSMHYGLTVYGDAVHEEVARQGGFRMMHGGTGRRIFEVDGGIIWQKRKYQQSRS